MYETYERDPVKYKLYQEAILSAMQDLNNKKSGQQRLVVLVAGAGRGLLVCLGKDYDPCDQI